MTKQCLEIVFCGLKMVTRCMLDDHFDDGKYGQANNLDCDIWSLTKSVATTDVESERDFSMFNQLMKLNPKALDLAYEDNILHIRNKANKWRNKLTPEELDKALEFAKKSKVGRKIHTFGIKN